MNLAPPLSNTGADNSFMSFTD